MKRFIPFLRQLREDIATGQEPVTFSTISGNQVTTRQGTKNQQVHPVMRRAIERAKSNPNKEVRVPDMKNPNNKEGILLGKLGDNESDYDFYKRLEQETERGHFEIKNGQSTWVDNPKYQKDDPRRSAMYGHYSDDANTERHHEQMLDFSRQMDSSKYDQSTGASREEMKAGRKEQEEYEKRMDAWWNEGGPSSDKELEQWKSDTWRLSAERRKKEEEMEQNYEKQAKEREQESERIRKENEKKAEERRKEQEQKRREQERSKPIARPEAGRAEPA